MDVSILLGWGAFSAFPLSTTSSWFPYGSPAGLLHDKHKLRPSSLAVTLYCVTTYVPFVLALWVFTRTFPPEGVMYILAHSFVCLGLLFEKLWNVMHWDRRRLGWAALISALAALSYTVASIFVGLTGMGLDRWEHVPLLVLLVGAGLWFLWITIEDATTHCFAQQHQERK